MNTDRIKQIQQETAYPESVSVQQALLKVWNETEQEQLRIGAVSGRSEQLASFLQWYVKDESKRDEPNRIVDIVERYLNETNCH